LLVLALLATLPAHARAHHSDAWAREHFATAERMREALNGRPSSDRTRRDYQRVVNAYRLVYLGAPTSTKADPSVVAVAETLVEMGRRFDDTKILNEAIAQYRFLRREYPGSKYRFDGLFTIGEIYKDDLNDGDAARATFQDFLHHYPHNRLSDGARQAIVELNQEAKAAKAADAPKLAEKVPASNAARINQDEAVADNAEGVRAASAKSEPPAPRAGRLPRVTGIRHWSTPDYTRVAIDVESDVNFSSQRIASPARIFFDLRDTKLASTLVGKTFDVDDGFLKKVRVAQFAPGRTRVVLEVDHLSDYDAFLLPNPYRLIIDIHSKKGWTKARKEAVASSWAQADRSLSAEANPELDPVSSDGKVPVAHAASAETETAASIEGGGNRAVASEPEVPTAAKKLQSAVVKRVVDADEDDDENVSVADPAPQKRNIRVATKKEVTSRTTAAKKLANSDLDGDPETFDSSGSGAGGSEVPETRPKSNSHALASRKSGGASALDVREARPTASGDRSLIRALGLKIGKIVIDPGHGGHDTGTIGPNGLEEKNLVLEVGRRLGKLLETRLGAEVVYTRKNDTFIPLETRTAIANQARADLFVSIHANSSHDPDARGVETYYLNFTSSPEALEVAARENAVSEKSIYELQDLVKKIALKEKIEESREFAGDVQQSLHSGLAVKSPDIRDRGVKKAPFIVLIGANMPSILAEISFVSNPIDEHRLATSEYRERIAESLYRGIAKYVNGLSGVKVASKMDKSGGP
jgi:N-acetylmuramoyl-L-alanine amidase